MNEYPSNETLDAVKAWNWNDCTGLFEFVKQAWWMPDWGWREVDGELHVSTGGWSGNEDLIEAMQANVMVWSLCWVQSRRGGHYVFEIWTGKETA